MKRPGCRIKSGMKDKSTPAARLINMNNKCTRWMNQTRTLMIVYGLLCCLGLSPAYAENALRIVVGAGYGPQWSNNTVQQNNSVIDLNFFFAELPIPRLGPSTLLMGLGYSYLWTDEAINTDNHVVSLLPAYRYTFPEFKGIQWFIHVASGPSIMSSKNLGQQEQGSKFIFNNYIGIGARFGKKHQWELSYTWRHLSNADIFKPNNGFDVPFYFSLGRVF
jgi:hypothetical protein